MNSAQQKIVQYLIEARASELALIRVLQSQIAMTPDGSYRSALEKHLDETRRHAQRVDERLKSLDRDSHDSNPVMVLVGFWEDVFGQVVAFSKTPLDLLRGSGGEEKLLKNAKDTCASEALEIATYTAIVRLARSVGDEETVELAQGILAEEEQMLQRVMRELPKLVDAVVGAEVEGDPSYDITTTGAADAVREATGATQTAARKTATATKRAARTARKAPGVAQSEGQIKGAVAQEDDLAIARYGTLTAEEIISRLSGLSQIDLAKVDSYERRHQNRTTILDRITPLRGDQPWPGYDELTVGEIQSVLSEGDEERVKQVRAYERSHKNRAGVLDDTERELSNAS